DSLAARTTGAQVLGAHAYSFPPMVMAADVAADVKGAAGLSDAVRKSFVPADDDEMKRANATAVQWVAQALAPGKGTPVALIVLWDDAARDGTATPLFVLVRGVEHPDGTYKINRVVYGHPERAIQ
ncbi:MAG TPA: hypothetical protein VK324_16285, partial [Tepidisphaeraceae bacterium]|nr:hypothetical protein [Tepidisphaeraceae bacterium]